MPPKSFKTASITQLKKKSEQLRKQLDQAIAAQHKARNAAFKRMSPAQRRVTLANDVLAQITVRRLVPTSGVYVQRADGKADFDGDKPFREIIDTKCEVCAKGALLVTAVERMNGVTLSDLNESGLDAIGSPDIKDYLSDIFEDDQLDLIEAAFENWDLTDRGKFDEDTAKELVPSFDVDTDELHYMNAVDVPTKRLRAIMQNIVKNNGEFKPERTRLSAG